MSMQTHELGTVQETLLIPLAARVIAPRRFPDLNFKDDIAAETARLLDADLERFHADRASMIGSVLRAAWFDKVSKAFLSAYANGLCISLGSGLDARAQRIGLADHPEADWVDIDFPDVVALRETLLPGHPQIHLMAHDITDVSWISKTPWTEGRPALVLSEGVFMYLDKEAGQNLITTLGGEADKRGSALRLAFDYASPTMVKFSAKHPSVSKTDAVFKWGLKSPNDLIALDPRLRLIEHTDVLAKSGLQPAAMKLLYSLFTGGRRIYGMAHFVRMK